MADTTAVDPVAEILRWVLQGQSARDIRQAAAKLWPKRDTEPLIVEALRELEATADRPDTLLNAFCTEAAREVYRHALEGRDCPTALRAIRTIAELGKKRRGTGGKGADGSDSDTTLSILDAG
jgi:hypothetical protein